MIKKFARRFLWENKLVCFVYGISAIANTVCPIILSINISSIINNLLIEQFDVNKFKGAIIMLIAYSVSNYIQNTLAIVILNTFQNDLLLDTYTAVINNKYSVINNQNTNSSYSQMLIQEIKNVSNYYSMSLINYFKGIGSVLITVLVLFTRDKVLTIILCMSIFIYGLIIKYSSKLIYTLQKEVINLQSKYFGKAQEVLENIEQIKYYNMYKFMNSTLNKAGIDYIHKFLQKLDIQILQNVLLKLMRYLFICIYVINTLINSGFVNHIYGDVLLVISLIEPFFDSCKLLVQFEQNRQSIRASKEILSFNIDNIDKAKTLEDSITIDSISNLKLINLHGKKQKCEKLNYSFEKNTVYCIVGENGIGKSTLFDILLGIDRDYEGKVLFNNIPATKINFEKLYGKSIIYMDQISELLEFIDTPNRTIDLSRGERQKKLLNDINESVTGKLVLLDEPSASLDEEQKVLLINKLNSLRKGNIVLIITHDEFLLNYDFEKLELIYNV